MIHWFCDGGMCSESTEMTFAIVYFSLVLIIGTVIAVKKMRGVGKGKYDA